MWPRKSWCTTRAPWEEQISTVRSVEPESTTTTSSAKPAKDSKQRPMFGSSFKVMMATDSFTSVRLMVGKLG